MSDISFRSADSTFLSRLFAEPKQLFFLLCTVHLILWTLAPALWQKNGALDVLEAIAWGNQWQFGYDRDPFLIAWVSQVASWFSGHSLWSIYFVSQVCVLTTFWAVWRTARELTMSQTDAFISVLFLEGIFYYHFTTPEFNDNVLQLPFWALSISYFYSALTQQRVVHWVFTGLFIALAMLAKYFTVMLMLPMALLLLTTREGRSSFRKPGLYLGAMMAFLVFLPNLLWQIDHQWQYIHYALDRSEVSASWLNHLREPLHFFIAQLLALTPALVLFIWATKARWSPARLNQFSWRYLVVMALGPMLTVIAYAAITGTHIRSMWGTPLFSIFGLLMVALAQPKLNRLPRFLAAFSAFFFVSWLGYVALVTVSPYVYGYAKNEFFPSQQLASDVTQAWHVKQQGKLPYVLGSRRLTSRVSVYSDDHPIPYFDLNSATSPWIVESDIVQQGAMVVWDVNRWGKAVPDSILKRFPGVQKLAEQRLAWQTGAPHIPPVLLGIAILPPKR